MRGIPGRLGAWVVRFDAAPDEARLWAVAMITNFNAASRSHVSTRFTVVGNGVRDIDLSDYGLSHLDWFDISSSTTGVMLGSIEKSHQPFMLIDDARGRVYYVVLGRHRLVSE